MAEKGDSLLNIDFRLTPTARTYSYILKWPSSLVRKMDFFLLVENLLGKPAANMLKKKKSPVLYQIFHLDSHLFFCT